MQHLYLVGLIVTMIMAGSARYDKNYGEMRALLMTAMLFLFSWLEKVI
jgi:hypothetical protein